MRTYWVVGEDNERRMTRLAPPRSQSVHSTSRGQDKVAPVSSVRLSQKRGSCEKDDKREAEKPLNGYIPQKDLSTDGERPPCRTVCCNSDDITDRHPFTSKRNSRTSDMLRLSMESECLKVQGSGSLEQETETEEEEEWSGMSAASPTGLHCQEESPLLRFGASSEKSVSGSSRTTQRCALSGETSV